MTVWYKQGVCGDLQGVAQKALGRVAKVLKSIHEDTFVTSKRDGNHSPGSFHYLGLAFDFRYPLMWNKGLKARLIKAIGKGFDIVFHETHIHVEWDPK